MIGAVTELRLASLDRVADKAATFPQRVKLAGRTAFRQIEPEFHKPLEHEPPKPARSPLEWASSKQRAAFYASNGFGRGIPTRRTHETSQGWQFPITADADSLTISITNTSPGAPFVYGPLRPGARDTQSRMHKITGWRNPRPAIVFFGKRTADAAMADLRRQFGAQP